MNLNGLEMNQIFVFPSFATLATCLGNDRHRRDASLFAISELHICWHLNSGSDAAKEDHFHMKWLAISEYTRTLPRPKFRGGIGKKLWGEIN